MDEIEQIRNAVRSLLEMVSARQEPLTPELRGYLEGALQHASNRITQLRQSQEIPRGAENLWVLSGANPNAFREYLRTFPNPQFNQIANEPARLSSLENRLSNTITLPAGEQAAGVPKAPLNSSNIYGFSYDPRNSALRVRFQGGGIYEYDNVPPAIFKAFQSGAIPARTNGRNQYGQWWVGKRPSLGATFFNLIRDRFPYARVA